MKEKLKKPNLKPNKTCTVYGIYDLIENELVSVSLDHSLLEMQFEMDGLDKDRFNIIQFGVILVQ
jgi:hypothetical protein